MIGRYFLFIFLTFLGSVFVLDFKTEMFEIPFLKQVTYIILSLSFLFYLFCIQIPKWKYFKRYFNTVTSLSYTFYYFNTKQRNSELLKLILLLLLFSFFSLFYSSLFDFDYFFFIASIYYSVDTFSYLLFTKNKLSYIITKTGIVTLNLSTDFISFKGLKSIELRDSILYFMYADGTMKSLNLIYLKKSDLNRFYNDLNIYFETNLIIRNQGFYNSL